MKKKYESPKILFQDMQLKEDIANVCWGGHGNSMTWYYDTKGEGYVSFQITGGKCTLNLDQVTYYDSKKNTTILKDGDAKYEELQQALDTSGGESGNPFKGEGVDFPTTPNENWS